MPDPSPPDCIFCQIVAGQAPKAVVDETDRHLAFLSIFPSTELATVVIPKDHQPSDFSQVDPAVVSDLVQAAQVVARQLKAADSEIERCVLTLEGLEVPHLHANLLPLRITDRTAWRSWPTPSEPLSSGTLESLAVKVRRAGR